MYFLSITCFLKLVKWVKSILCIKWNHFFETSEIWYSIWVSAICFRNLVSWNITYQHFHLSECNMFSEISFLKLLFEWAKSFFKWVKPNFLNEQKLFYEASRFVFWIERYRGFEILEMSYSKRVNQMSEVCFMKRFKFIFIWNITASWNKFFLNELNYLLKIIVTCCSFKWNNWNQLYQMSEIICLMKSVKSVFWNVWNKFWNE